MHYQLSTLFAATLLFPACLVADSIKVIHIKSRVEAFDMHVTFYGNVKSVRPVNGHAGASDHFGAARGTRLEDVEFL